MNKHPKSVLGKRWKIKDTSRMKGHTPWNKGKGNKAKCACGKVFNASPSDVRRGRKSCSLACKDQTGDKNGSWRGGVTPDHVRIRKSSEYRVWRRAVMKRDGGRCVKCKSEKDVQVDHIKSFALHPELRFKQSNGRVLCKKHHQETPTFGYNVKYLSSKK